MACSNTMTMVMSRSDVFSIHLTEKIYPERIQHQWPSCHL